MLNASTGVLGGNPGGNTLASAITAPYRSIHPGLCGGEMHSSLRHAVRATVCFGQPPADGLVVRMVGESLGPEREDRVGLDGSDDVFELGCRFVCRHVGARSVAVVEPEMFGDTEDGQALVELLLADLGHDVGREAFGIRRTGLASRCGHAYDARSGIGGHGHDSAGEEGLVVGVGPDAEDRPELVNAVRIHRNSISLSARRREARRRSGHPTPRPRPAPSRRRRPRCGSSRCRCEAHSAHR